MENVSLGWTLLAQCPDLEIQKIIYEKSAYYHSSPVLVALWSSNYLS